MLCRYHEVWALFTHVAYSVCGLVGSPGDGQVCE